LFKANKSVRISKYIWQRVPDCRASMIKSPTAVRAKPAARNSETIQVSGYGEEQHQRSVCFALNISSVLIAVFS